MMMMDNSILVNDLFKKLFEYDNNILFEYDNIQTQNIFIVINIY